MRSTKNLALALVTFLGLAGIATATDRGSGAHPKEHAGLHASGSKQLQAHMQKSGNEMRTMKTTGDVDHDFVMGMKKHHQHGVDMARIELEHGKDPQAKQFAQRIIDQQQKEIAELDQWLGQHAPAKAAGAK